MCVPLIMNCQETIIGYSTIKKKATTVSRDTPRYIALFFPASIFSVLLSAHKHSLALVRFVCSIRKTKFIHPRQRCIDASALISLIPSFSFSISLSLLIINLVLYLRLIHLRFTFVILHEKKIWLD